MVKIGLDIGYSNVKVVTKDLQKIFPSAVGTADVSRFRLNASPESESQIISIPGDGTWMFGNEAVENSRTLHRREDRNWIDTDDYYRLFLSALSFVVGNQEVKLVTGLPVSYYEDKSKLETIMMGEHDFTRDSREPQKIKVTSVKVVPQPFGTALNVALDMEGQVADAKALTGYIGVIDIGGKTTNVLSCYKMTERERQTTSVNAGAWDIVRALRIKLEQKYPELELRDHEIINVIRDKAVRYYGADEDVDDIVTECINPISQRIIGDAQQLWGGAASMDKVVITGGGAYIFGEYIKSHFKHAEVAELPEISNCVGYYKLACRS